MGEIQPPQELGASGKPDRASRPAAQAPAGLGDTATIPSAVEHQEREWTLWSDQRPPNAPGAYRYRATFPLLGMTVTAEWTEEMHLCGMGYGDSEYWPLRPCYWDGYKRYITIANLEWSPVSAYDPEEIVWNGLNLLPCPFTGVMPKVETQGQYIGAPLWRTEALWISSPGVPKRRWTDAKAMQASWNRRQPAQGIEAATAGETACGLDPTDESPVGSADAPNPANPASNLQTKTGEGND